MFGSSVTYRMYKDEGVIKGKNRKHHIKVCFEILQSAIIIKILIVIDFCIKI